MPTDTEPVDAEAGQQGANQSDLLNQQEYRYLLQFLADTEAPTSTRELATHLTSQTCEAPPTTLSSAQRRRSLARVRHLYLPRLEARGVVTAEPQHGIVQLTAQGAQLVQTLTRDP